MKLSRKQNDAMFSSLVWDMEVAIAHGSHQGMCWCSPPYYLSHEVSSDTGGPTLPGDNT